MRTAFVGSKIVTTGITNPVQLNRGEMAFFSASGVLIDKTSSLQADTPITMYRGLGQGRIDVGATLYKGRLSKTMAASVVGVSSKFTATKGIANFENRVAFRTIVKDPFLTTNYPREYSVEIDRGLTETKDEFLVRFKAAIDKKVLAIQKDLGNAAQYTCNVTITAGVDGAPSTITIAVTASYKWMASVTVEGIDFESVVHIPAIFPKGLGKDVLEIEKEMAVHRGRNKELTTDKGGFSDDYFTTDVNKTYKLYCVASMTQSPNGLNPEDDKGYLVEQYIFIDEVSTPNITAADELIQAL